VITTSKLFRERASVSINIKICSSELMQHDWRQCWYSPSFLVSNWY